MFPALIRRTIEPPFQYTFSLLSTLWEAKKYTYRRRWIYYSPTRITAHLQISSDFLFLFSHRVISTFFLARHAQRQPRTHILGTTRWSTNLYKRFHHSSVQYTRERNSLFRSWTGFPGGSGSCPGWRESATEIWDKKHWKKKVLKNIFPYYWLLLIHVCPAAVVSRVGILLLLRRRHRRRGRGLRQGF